MTEGIDIRKIFGENVNEITIKTEHYKDGLFLIEVNTGKIGTEELQTLLSLFQYEGATIFQLKDEKKLNIELTVGDADD